MQKIIIPFALIAIVFTGCGKNDSRPKDLPPLHPCTVTITQDGKPLDGAVVQFAAVDAENKKYQASSMTDAEGHVVMKTYGFDGVPAGKYKVCVWKTVVEGVTSHQNSDGEMVDTVGTEYKTVEPQYADAKTTPHEIEITGKEKKVEQTFDVGKAVKIKQ
jgi:hypothetical protein